jgi:hypothetical protein
MSRTKVTLVATLLWVVPVAHAAQPEESLPVAQAPNREPLSESAANRAACMYRAKLAYEVVNFRAKGGKRELFQLSFSDRVDPDLKAQTLAAVDLAFDANGTAEEVATLVYEDCTGTHI